MRRSASRSSFKIAPLVLLAGLLIPLGSQGSNGAVLQPDKLLILSTTDIKGKTGPCGCHIPKGGLPRLSSYADSMRTSFGQVLWVDNGGFFPDDDTRKDAAWFLIDAMKTLGLDAVNVGDRDLRYGRAFLAERARKDGLPLVSANLLDKQTRKPLFSPYVIKKVGTVTVGVFGLISDKADLGPGKDSLAVVDPKEAARASVIELRRRGAQVILLLSQLGKTQGEDLVTAVDGIDAVMLGNNVMLLQRGRMVKNTIGCYGGEQGQYFCRTDLALDPKRHMASAEAEAVMMGPEVRDKPEVAALVKGFEDALAEKNRKLDMEHAVQAQAANSPSHYLGDELCIRCHAKQGEQWKTTSHARAWQTLVTAKRETDAACVSCHSTGYQKPGGFTSAAATPKLGNVQCESCHGMGTEHETNQSKTQAITAQTCLQCHTKEQDRSFDYAKKLALIVHGNLSGETLRALPSKMGANQK